MRLGTFCRGQIRGAWRHDIKDLQDIRFFRTQLAMEGTFPTLWTTRGRRSTPDRQTSVCLFQYVARPPEISKTAPVVNEHSAELQNAASDAISSTSTKRPFGILESMKSMCCLVICAKSAVRAAAGVMQFTVIS